MTRPRAARRLSVRRADRPHRGRPASPQAPARPALRHVRMPFAGNWPDHRGRVDLATVDTHRAAEAPPVAPCFRGSDERVRPHDFLTAAFAGVTGNAFIF